MRGVRDTYLFIYNIVCLSGWSSIFTMLVLYMCLTRSYEGIYYLVESLMQCFQSLAILEIFHSLFGLVKSNPIFVAMQVFGRLFIVWVTFYEPYQVTSDNGIFLIIFCWSLTEIIRYGFYAWSIAHNPTVPYQLIWMRYSAFIVLYPLGVLGEVLTTKSVFEQLVGWKLFPIQYESSFIYVSMSHIVLALTIPYFVGFIALYRYMLNQRRKVLGRTRTYLAKTELKRSVVNLKKTSDNTFPDDSNLKNGQSKSLDQDTATISTNNSVSKPLKIE